MATGTVRESEAFLKVGMATFIRVAVLLFGNEVSEWWKLSQVQQWRTKPFVGTSLPRLLKIGKFRFWPPGNRPPIGCKYPLMLSVSFLMGGKGCGIRTFLIRIFCPADGSPAITPSVLPCPRLPRLRWRDILSSPAGIAEREGAILFLPILYLATPAIRINIFCTPPSSICKKTIESVSEVKSQNLVFIAEAILFFSSDWTIRTALFEIERSKRPQTIFIYIYIYNEKKKKKRMASGILMHSCGSNRSQAIIAATDGFRSSTFFIRPLPPISIPLGKCSVRFPPLSY
ncbi:hypothetical protein CDAR_471081 [Caerostris darwini]|uniref:Uncharacterized protein n=1 Tax=Caerostris darwini TaxID=1538125 RepID=A0AAV4QLA9_9ARAC|nr:hypothetical protein CDAR_471081 [Caerostris darwini]